MIKNFQGGDGCNSRFRGLTSGFLQAEQRGIGGFTPGGIATGSSP